MYYIHEYLYYPVEGFLILSYKSPSHYITELLFSLIIIYIYTCTCILKFVVSGYLLVEVIMCGISLDIMCYLAFN